jgi:hypothetical protein
MLYTTRLKLKKLAKIFLETAKWGLIVFLLWPLTKAVSEPVNFNRIVFGILFFILFSGKLFYDLILQTKKEKIERSATADMLSIFGVALAIALIIGLLVVSIGMAVFLSLQEMPK